jgi:hypothetical protein
MNASQKQWLVAALLISCFGLFPLYAIIKGVSVSIKRSTRFAEAVTLQKRNKFTFVCGILVVLIFAYACLASIHFFWAYWIFILAFIWRIYLITQSTIRFMATLQGPPSNEE